MVIPGACSCAGDDLFRRAGDRQFPTSGATSIHDFLLAHHARQPTLPLLYDRNSIRKGVRSLDIIPFDHRAGLTAADQLHPVARLDSSNSPGSPFWDVLQRPEPILEASCDAILVLSINRSIAGMYRHTLTCEYQLLLYEVDLMRSKYAYHVFTIGSGQPPRHVGFQDAPGVSFLFHGSLHWCICQLIIVFDTTTELFWQMRSPIVHDTTDPLFEMDGMLSVYKGNDTGTSIDIWVLEDYISEVWAFKCRVELPVDKLRVQFGVPFSCTSVVARSFDGDLLVLASFGDRLLHIDSDGKLVASFHRMGLIPSRLMLKQTLVRHTFFPALEGYVVNASPFI